MRHRAAFIHVLHNRLGSDWFSGKVAEGCEIKTIPIIATNVLHSNNDNRACIDEGDQMIGWSTISFL